MTTHAQNFNNDKGTVGSDLSICATQQQVDLSILAP